MNLAEKLLAIQTELKASKGQRNTFGNYNYRSCEDILEAVKPLLNQHRCVLYLTDEIIQVGDKNYVKATAILGNVHLDSEGNLSITTTAFAREEETKKGMDASQITGAASSYARKYALNGLFAIDDAKDSDATNKHGKDKKEPASTDDDPLGTKPVCSDCGASITAAVVTFSKKKYGKALCPACQQK